MGKLREKKPGEITSNVRKLLNYFVPFTGYPYIGERVSCPVCGSTDHAQICALDRRIKRLTTDLCANCGLFFTNPMPTNEELNQYYASTYRAEYQFAFIRPRKTHQNKKKREAVRRSGRMKEVIGLEAPVRTLDFGCGSGELVRHMAELGHSAHGFEQGAAYGTFAKQKTAEDSSATGSVHVGSWREMDFAPKSFDIISCLHVLEHLNDPVGALKAMHDWLADDGVLYLETPNMQGYTLKGFDVFHFAHVLGFSKDNLLYASKQAGFQLLHEDGPTSFFLVKADNPKGKTVTYNLQHTAAKNLSEYSEGTSLGSYTKRHARRITKMLRSELKGGR